MGMVFGGLHLWSGRLTSYAYLLSVTLFPHPGKPQMSDRTGAAGGVGLGETSGVVG